MQASGPFETHYEVAGDVVIGTVIGEGDIVNADKLEHFLTTLVAMHPRKLIVDLSRLVFVSSLAMGKLVAVRKSIIKHGGTMILAAPSPLVDEALRRARLHELFAIVPSLDEAKK